VASAVPASPGMRHNSINEVRVYGLTYIFTCRKCGQPAGGLVADVPEKGQKE